VFDQPYLFDGIPLIVMIVAMLAGPEAFRLLLQIRVFPDRKKLAGMTSTTGSDSDTFTLRDYLRLFPTHLRGSLLGTFVGALPGPGPTKTAADEAKRAVAQAEKVSPNREALREK